eukprot:CAMPEP_0119552408 /NCGR_PEP_ID=MMETSP1352-20130426/5425_1 /TAXON_ID=265584 /ORGANISM="Stauroneis constricta, Strain CCMP1120" /LENGTH=486 /DNA_ID=CAMNT_0007598649 /DNA_START=71 /DNA_END=1534 /DNA_ORIENTATION=+
MKFTNTKHLLSVALLSAASSTSFGVVDAFIINQPRSLSATSTISSIVSSPPSLAPSSSLHMSTLAPTSVSSTTSDDDDDDDENDSDSDKKSSKATTAKKLLPKGAISMQIDELARVLGGKGRAKIAWDCYSIGIDPANFFGSVIRLGYDDFETIQNMLPSSRRWQTLGTETLERLASCYPTAGGMVEGGVAKLSHISRAADSTTKLLLKLEDGLEVETVIIPWKGQRSTLCISSQVGCRQGCTFCATGRMGRLRSLNSDEILAQMFYAKKICRLNGLPDITNIVFMGMGEPADNADNVITAAEILTTRELFQLAQKKVVVSTVAPTPDAFRKFGAAPVALAWSVHAVNDDIRKRLVPTTKYSMVELRQGLIDSLLARPESGNCRSIMLEVALMAGVNDSMQCADDMIDFAKVIIDEVPGCKLVVNLIPFNDIGHEVYERPTDDAVKTFQTRLQAGGVYTCVRATRGDDKTAACGQLATKKAKKLAP